MGLLREYPGSSGIDSADIGQPSSFERAATPVVRVAAGIVMVVWFVCFYLPIALPVVAVDEAWKKLRAK